MSKISEYLQEVAAFHAKRSAKLTTVAGYADELNRPVETLIEQLNEAGLKKSATDSLSDDEKSIWLEHLRHSHSSAGSERKKITFRPMPDHMDRIEAVADKVNGAEWETLEEFALTLAFGHEITPNLQHLVNLIVAKAFFVGALPDMRRGRPKCQETKDVGLQIAFNYWAMRDAGKSYSETVIKLSEHFHKDERHVMRMVKEHTHVVGKTKSQRDFWRMAREVYSGNEEDIRHQTLYGSMLRELPEAREFEAEDFIERIDEQIQAQREALELLTQKGANLTPVTKDD